MRFLLDKEKKVIFGWSAKCGCTHIKRIFFYLRDNEIIDNMSYLHNHNRCNNDLCKLDIENYTIILIIRNPYERLVSGFLDKYGVGKDFRKRWNTGLLTFSSFVKELESGQWDQIDRHHFIRQTSEAFNLNLLKKSKQLLIYDVNNIDYNFIENIFEKKIHADAINFKGRHIRKDYIDPYPGELYDLDIDLYCMHKINYNQLYNDDLKNRVRMIYKSDFDFFEENGFNYTI